MRDYQNYSSIEQVRQSGCYLYCLIVGSGYSPLSIDSFYPPFLKKGLIQEDCFILNPCRILEDLTGQKYRVIKTKIYDPEARLKIAQWHNPKTGYSHFVLMKNESEVLFDSLGDSKTVRDGFIESWRLFYLS